MKTPVALAGATHSLIVQDGEGGFTLRHDGRPPAEMRKCIDALVQQMLTVPETHMELRVEHKVEDGMYLRKLYIPKGTLVVGKIHLKSCHNIVAAGSVDILTEFGSKRLYAGFNGVSQPGSQKVAFAHEDAVFVNVFRSDLTDIIDLEKELFSLEHIEDRLHVSELKSFRIMENCKELA